MTLTTFLTTNWDDFLRDSWEDSGDTTWRVYGLDSSYTWSPSDTLSDILGSHTAAIVFAASITSRTAPGSSTEADAPAATTASGGSGTGVSGGTPTQIVIARTIDTTSPVCSHTVVAGDVAYLSSDAAIVTWPADVVWDTGSDAEVPTLSGGTGDTGDGRECHPNADVPDFQVADGGVVFGVVADAPTGNWEDAATEWDEPLGDLGTTLSVGIYSAQSDVLIPVDTDLHVVATLTVTDYAGDGEGSPGSDGGIVVYGVNGGSIAFVQGAATPIDFSSVGTVLNVDLNVPVPAGHYDQIQVIVGFQVAKTDGITESAWAWKVEGLDAYMCQSVIPAGVSLQLYLKNGDGPAWVDVGGPIAPLTSRGGTKDDPGVTITRTSTQQNQYSRYNSGRITATLENYDGQWDPVNLSGPWVTDGKTLLHEGLPVRLFVTPDGADDPILLFNGKVSDWPPSYLGNIWSDVPFVGIDAADALRAANLTALQVPVGAGESAGERIQRILTSIGWTGGADVDTTMVHPLQATTLSQGAWAEILLAADSDGGFVWIDRFGKLIYKLRDYAVDATPALTLSMNEEADTYIYENVTPNNDTALLFNVAKLARVGGMEQSAVAFDAASSYTGYRSTARTDLVLQQEADVMEQALWTVGMFRNVEYRFSQVVVRLKRSSPLAEWLAVAQRDIGDLVEIHQVTPDGRTIIRQGLISGCTALIRPTADVFRFTFDLIPAPPIYGPYFFDDDAGIFDDPIVFAFERSA